MRLLLKENFLTIQNMLEDSHFSLDKLLLLTLNPKTPNYARKRLDRYITSNLTHKVLNYDKMRLADHICKLFLIGYSGVGKSCLFAKVTN